MNANERRILAKLWKDRHTHPGGELQEIEQRLIRVETGLDPVATQSGAHIHLLAGSQTVGSTGAMVEWDSFDSQNPARNFSPSLPVTWVPVMLDGYYRIRPVFRLDSYHGGLVEVYRRRGSNEVKVWPPDDSLVSSLHGDRVGADADGIEFRAGDEIGIRLIPGAGATVTLLSGWLTVVLVDRTPQVPVEAPSADWELVFATSNKRGVTFDGTNWWLTDPRSSISPTFYKYDTSWNLVAAVGETGFNGAHRGIVAFDGDLFTAGRSFSGGNHVRQISPSDGTVLASGASVGADFLGDITVRDGKLFALSGGGSGGGFRIREFDSSLNNAGTFKDFGLVSYSGVAYDAANSIWYLARPPSFGDINVYTFSDDLGTELSSFEAPEQLDSLALVSGYLYGVGESGVWRRAVT